MYAICATQFSNCLGSIFYYLFYIISLCKKMTVIGQRLKFVPIYVCNIVPEWFTSAMLHVVCILIFVVVNYNSSNSFEC
jgi:hypothetical protein